MLSYMLATKMQPRCEEGWRCALPRPGRDRVNSTLYSVKGLVWQWLCLVGYCFVFSTAITPWRLAVRLDRYWEGVSPPTQARCVGDMRAFNT